ncbi:lipopolysaccharide kinase InaA family protein [Porticoccus sp.]
MNSLSTPRDTARAPLSFDDWWQLQGDWVEEPNRRRGGESGVKRCQLKGQTYYVKRQVGHLFRNLRHPLGCPTIVREAHRLEICRQLGVAAPEIVFCQVRRGGDKPRSLLVTRELPGYRSVEEWYASEPDGPARQQLLNHIYARLGETLARLHNGRWQHGCLYDKHVFFKPVAGNSNDVEVALIDLEKCRRKLTVARASKRDVLQLRRHMPDLTGANWRTFVDHYSPHVNLTATRARPWLSLTN